MKIGARQFGPFIRPEAVESLRLGADAVLFVVFGMYLFSAWRHGGAFDHPHPLVASPEAVQPVAYHITPKLEFDGPSHTLIYAWDDVKRAGIEHPLQLVRCPLLLDKPVRTSVDRGAGNGEWYVYVVQDYPGRVPRHVIDELNAIRAKLGVKPVPAQ